MTCDTELWDHLFHVQSGIELSNMGLERMLARFRKCAPGKHPLIERIASAGTLSQFLASHRAAGGKHPLERQRSSLLAAGVHLKVRSKFQKDGRKSRANVRYAAARYKDTPVTSLTPYVTQFGAFSHIHNVHRKLAIAVPSLQCAQEIRAAHIAAGDRITRAEYRRTRTVLRLRAFVCAES